MSIEAIKGPRGEEMARCTCADCGTVETVRAAHGTCSGGRGKLDMHLKSDGQAIRKIEAQGWALVKGRLRCPDCEAKRREKTEPKKDQQMEKTAATITTLRQPTPKQKREIIGILEDVYDDDSKRYRGQETDKTVAETIGGGVMPGWVAEIREEMFGPDGGNDEMEVAMAAFGEARTEFRALFDRLEGLEKKADEIRVEMKAQNERLNSAVARLEAIRKAVGPKAARA